MGADAAVLTHGDTSPDGENDPMRQPGPISARASTTVYGPISADESARAAGIPVLKDTAVQRAAMRLTIAAGAETQSAAGV